MTLDARVYTPGGVDHYDDVAAAYTAPGETWVHAGAVGGGDGGDLERLIETFGIHPLAIEDVRDEHTRPKVEEYDGHTFLLLKSARLSQEGDVAFRKEVQVTPVGLFVGPDWLITMTAGEVDPVSRATARWADQAERVATRGTDFIAYRVIDGVVDGYFDTLDELEDDIELIEEQVLDEADPDLLEALNDVRRDLLAFRKVTWPAREAVGELSRDCPQVAPRNEKYFRDVHDHLVQVVDLIETYRDLTAGSRDIYLNTVSMSTNEVMKTLTVVATIFIPLTFVAGVYGMNFADTPYAMPELSWTFGYPAAMLGMAAIAVVMLAHFRRQGWL